MRRFATEFINPAIMQDQRVRQALMPAGSGAFDRLERGTYDDAIMRRARGMGAVPSGLPSAPPKQTVNLMDRLTPAMGSPAQAGLGAAAAKGLQLSGYRQVPITTAEGIGAMAEAGMKAYTAERKAQQAAELARQQRETAIALKMMEIRAASAKTGRDIEKTKFDQEGKLRKEFKDESKMFRDTMENYNKAYSVGMKKNPTGASDLALVFSFMKTLDPGSVVREGEQAQAQNAGGVPANIRNFYNSLLTGQKFDPVVRAQIMDAARSLVLGQIDTQRRIEENYAQLVDQYGLTSSNVFQSLLPKAGSYLLPHEISSPSEIDNYSVGEYVMLNDEILQVAEQ